MPTDTRVSRFMLLSAREGVDELMAHAAALGVDLRDFHTNLFRQYRQEVREAFAANALTIPDAKGEPEQHWNAVQSITHGVTDDLLASLDELLQAIADEDEEVFHEELDAAFIEGNRRTLWLAALGGIEAEEYADSLPEVADRDALLLAAGVAGLSWLDRLRRWEWEASHRGGQWLRATVLGGRTLDDTLQGLDSASTAFHGHVVQLLTDELHRGYAIGGRTALQAVSRDHDLAQLWVARTRPNGDLDPLVCPVCAALHLTVTFAEPVVDTHPNCRCAVIPVPEDYRERRLDYARFVEQLDGDD